MRVAVVGHVGEQEELDLRVRVEGEAQVGGAPQRPLQHVAGVGVARRPVRQRDVERLGSRRMLRHGASLAVA